MEADTIVSNADVAFTYRGMIKPTHRKKYSDRKIARTKYSMSFLSSTLVPIGNIEIKAISHNIILGSL